MYDAIWQTKGVDYVVVVLEYLGKGNDGRRYVSIEGSSAGIPLDELQFIDPDDPMNPFTSVWINEVSGTINLAE